MEQALTAAATSPRGPAATEDAEGRIVNKRTHAALPPGSESQTATIGLWTTLLLDAQKGEPGALVKLFELAEPELWRFVHALLGDAHEADEVVNETFAKVWQKLQDYDPARGASGRTWLYTIAERRALDHRRKIKRRQSREVARLDGASPGADTSGRFDVPDTAELSPAEAADLPYRQALVRVTLARLRSSDRRILQLFYFDELPYAAIAEDMNISLKAVGPRLTRARERFEELLPAEQL